MDAIERLQELLDAKDTELCEVREQNEKLERELEGTLDGWRVAVELKDDESLPVPRLELVYEQIRGWDDYRVTYRLVVKHLLGHLVGIPLSFTKIGGRSCNVEPDHDHLPLRDGAHAAHDSTHLRCAVFKLMPGKSAEQVSLNENFDHQMHLGREHRRDALAGSTR